jgi:small subunit ribosomal protein S2
MRDSGDFGRITKKEGLIVTREIDRLEGLLSGLRKLVRPPDLLFVVDVAREFTAIHEANLLNIPVVAMVDTNCDPRNVDYVIPSNDDAIRAIKLVVGKIADAALEGLGARKEEIVEEAERTVARAAVEEEELSDEELLGEATLAKLVAHPREISPAELDEMEEELEDEKEEELELDEEDISELTEEESEEEAEEEGEEESAVEETVIAPAEDEAEMEEPEDVEEPAEIEESDAGADVESEEEASDENGEEK